MSTTKIPQKVKYELLLRSAGRCEFQGCNKPLFLHHVTYDFCKIAEYAHIIADSPSGPRGCVDSKELAKDISNIMLLCPDCHKYIDIEGKDKYDANALKAMKERHESRILKLTSMKEDDEAHIVTYGAKIADVNPEFSFSLLQQALLPNFYPAKETTIDLGGNWFVGKDWNEFWKHEVEQLEYSFKEYILSCLPKWENKRIALFAFAPMPLLIKLGTLLNNKYEVEVFQKQRIGGWTWPSTKEHIDFQIKNPVKYSGSPVLVVSLSFPICERIKRNRPDASIWEVTIEKTNPDFLQSRAMLYDFGRCMEKVFDDISRASATTPIDLYISAPVACVVELGRVWMKKANAPLNVYDYDKRYSKEDKLAITIKNENV